MFINLVTAQEGPGIVTVHPAGQDVELLCTVMTSNDTEAVAWLINHMGPFRLNALLNGVVAGYSTRLNENNLIVKNITMNDNRNDTEYRCVITTQDTTQGATPTILRSGDPTILYVAGEYQCRCDIHIIGVQKFS